jgi:hypothetical protein
VCGGSTPPGAIRLLRKPPHHGIGVAVVVVTGVSVVSGVDVVGGVVSVWVGLAVSFVASGVVQSDPEDGSVVPASREVLVRSGRAVVGLV